MAKSLYIASISGESSDSVISTTGRYIPMFGALIQTNSQERVSIYAKYAGVFSNLTAIIGVNSTSGGSASTIRFDKNDADGNQVVSIPIGTTGTFTDSSNTDSVVVDDRITYRADENSTSGSFTIYSLMSQFEPTDTSLTATVMGVTSNTVHESDDSYYPLSTKAWTLNASNDFAPINMSGKMKHLMSNAGITDQSHQIIVYQNGVATDLVITSSQTGLQQDNDEFSFDSDDILAFRAWLPQTVLHYQMSAYILSESNGNQFPLVSGEQTIEIQSSGETFYYNISGFLVAVSSETNTRLPIPFDCEFSKMQIKVEINSQTVDQVMRFRKNGSNGNQVITIPNETTGTFVDLSNTDEVESGDEVNYSIVTGAGSGSFAFALTSMIGEEIIAGGGPITMDVTDTVVLTNKFITKV